MDNSKGVLERLGIPEKQAVDLLFISKTRQIRNGESYISEGQIPKTFAIAIQGLFRYYYIDVKGNEFTKGFILPETVLSAYSAMLHQTPSFFIFRLLKIPKYWKWIIKNGLNCSNRILFGTSFLSVLWKKAILPKKKENGNCFYSMLKRDIKFSPQNFQVWKKG